MPLAHIQAIAETNGDMLFTTPTSLKLVATVLNAYSFVKFVTR